MTRSLPTMNAASGEAGYSTALDGDVETAEVFDGVTDQASDATGAGHVRGDRDRDRDRRTAVARPSRSA